MGEQLKIYNHLYEPIGVALRDEVHQQGYWHEVFQCWVIEKVGNEWRIYLQLRSQTKKDYPGQFDITAAGHLLANEKVEDGIREMQEELGITAEFSQLTSLGIIPYVIDNDTIKDYEFAHVFLYELSGGLDAFTIQIDELDGIYYTKLEDFIRLAKKELEMLEVHGYYYDHLMKVNHAKNISLKDMSSLPAQYLDELVLRLRRKMEK